MTSKASRSAALWYPDPEPASRSRLALFHAWATEHHGAPRGDDGNDGGHGDYGRYAALHQWSVDSMEDFWRALAEWFDVRFSTTPTTVLGRAQMPGAQWFPGVRLNYAEQALRHGEDPQRQDEAALVHLDETRAEPQTVTWLELRRQVGALAARLRQLGVRPGDRVAAFVPNIPQAVTALLATAAVGAVWTSCAPDFGAHTVLARFQQVEPVVLFAVDGYRYGGKPHDRGEVVEELRRELPTLRHVVHIPVLGGPAPANVLLWDDVTAGNAALAFAWVPFEHPLWLLYSSGTTGLPKGIVQGHGGIVLEHLKQAGLHFDLGPGERFFWYTSTGWMMWNFLLAGLLAGASIVTYDGSPAHPDTAAQWRVAARTGATVFGTSAAYVTACGKAGVHPGRDLDLGRLRAVGVTGSPLPPDGFRWIYEEIGTGVWLASISGGTDVCSCFVGGVPTLPVYAGEIQAPSLGVAVESWTAEGTPVRGEVGELVVTKPMPSMPVSFWNDPGGARYRDSYFAMFPGIWRHGDWITITERNTVVVHGRSDSTLNRQGVRMGSSDIYEIVERLPFVRESLVVGLEQPDGGYWMPLFVVLADGTELDDGLREDIRGALRRQLSPRHVPDDIIPVSALPYTLTGKRLEVPVKRVLHGTPIDEAVNRGAVRNPKALDFFAELARQRG